MAVYAVVMASTNGSITMLDDESKIITIAGHPGLPTLKLFVSGRGQHEHPPVSDILLHLWLEATHYSFFALRIFANLFFIAAVFYIARAAETIAGKSAYWTTLILGFVWPFAFQYGRMSGWYCVCAFLISWVTSIYLQLQREDGWRSWIAFAVASVLLLWSNYFGVVILALLLVDLFVFHRDLAARRTRSLITVTAVIVLSFLPLVGIALRKLTAHTAPAGSGLDIKGAIAAGGYPIFSIFASAAVAPWFLPLSIPIVLAAIALVWAIWVSPGRRWLVYFLVSMALLALSAHINIKRVIFLVPWLFLAIGLAACSKASRYPRMAIGAAGVLIVAGWLAIASGKHYATTNLHEPWGRVAEVVAQDARNGAMVVSENYPFFFYLDYKLGLGAETAQSIGPYLGEEIYRSHGYTIRMPDKWKTWADQLHGKIVIVNGSALKEQVDEENALNDVLKVRCKTLGAYRAAPDPAAEWKQRFAKSVAVLPYRTEVIWYDCPQ
jgi:hypothetical protein